MPPRIPLSPISAPIPPSGSRRTTVPPAPLAPPAPPVGPAPIAPPLALAGLAPPVMAEFSIKASRPQAPASTAKAAANGTTTCPAVLFRSIVFFLAKIPLSDGADACDANPAAKGAAHGYPRPFFGFRRGCGEGEIRTPDSRDSANGSATVNAFREKSGTCGNRLIRGEEVLSHGLSFQVQRLVSAPRAA